MHTCSKVTLSIFAALMASACSGSGDDASGDKTAPLIIVTSPDRGSVSSEETVIVEGVASDEESGIRSLSVAGIDVPVDADGSFRAELALDSGLTLLHVVAIDGSGNESRRTRAVLSGSFAPADQAVTDAARVYVGQEALAAVAETSEAVLDGLDLDALLVAANPVVSEIRSGCLGATVDLQEISYNNLEVTLEPVEGGLRAFVQIAGLQADARAYHTIACLNGSTAIHVAANEVEVEASLELSVSGGALVAHVDGSEARFDNLTVDVGILPSSVIEFVVGDFDDKLGTKLSALMAKELPPIVEAKIAQLSKDHEVALLGKSLDVSVQPSSVDFNSAGGTIYLETKVTGIADGAPYLSNPMPLPAIAGDQGVSVAISDDALNQALSALWDTGALNRNIELSSESGADIGGGILDHVQLSAPLPPVIGANAGDGSLKLIVGDMQLDLLKTGEQDAVSRIAISLELDINVVEEAGQLKIATAGEPIIHMDRVGSDGFLNDRDLEILVAFASNMLAGDLNRLLGEIPLPSFEGTSLANASVVADGGYLQVGANLIR